MLSSFAQDLYFFSIRDVDGKKTVRYNELRKRMRLSKYRRDPVRLWINLNPYLFWF